MAAENMQRAALEQSMAYVHDDFAYEAQQTRHAFNRSEELPTMSTDKLPEPDFVLDDGNEPCYYGFDAAQRRSQPRQMNFERIAIKEAGEFEVHDRRTARRSHQPRPALHD